MAAKNKDTKAKGRIIPATAAQPKRQRPSQAKAAVVKPERVTASVGTASTDPVLRLDPDLVSYTPTASPIEASIAERLAVYQLELEYKHYEDDSNPVSSLIKRNAQEACTHTATISLVITDFTKYVNDGRSASGAGVIELAEGGQLTEELKYYVNQAIHKFVTAVNSRITVTRAVVQRFTLPGITFII